MAARPDPAARLAERLLATLEVQRAAGGDAYPLTLQRLGELAEAGAEPALLVKAAARKPFAERAVAARKRDATAPVALRDDLPRLADSPLLLVFALEARCTPAKPAWPPDKLAAALVPELRQPFTESVRRRLADNALPAAAGSVPGKSGPLLYLHRLPPPPPPKKPDVVLAEKLLLTLEAQRRLGPGAYPLPLRRLAELADAQAPPKLLRQATAGPLFLDRAVVARPKDDAAPVALRTDLAQLAASPLLLEYALGAACTARQPAVPLDKLTGLLAPELRESFAEAVRRWLAENTLPAVAGSVPGKTGPLLHLQRLPPPKKPEVALAERLMAVLTARRQQGGTAYPLTLRQLLELADPAAAPAVVKKALAGDAFKGQAVLAVKSDPDTPVALAADAGRLAGSPLLLEHLLRATRTASSHAAAAAELKRKLAPALQQPFAEAAGRQLPPAVGCVLHRGKQLYFLVTDVLKGQESVPSTQYTGRSTQRLSEGAVVSPGGASEGSPGRVFEPAVGEAEKSALSPGGAAEPAGGPQSAAPPGLIPGTVPPQSPGSKTRPGLPSDAPPGLPPDFRQAFDAAFDRLQQRPGADNYVSLLDLRRALPAFNRQAFDAGLAQLRSAGVYSLRLADGRFGITPEERDAGVPTPDGALLLYVSRNTP
jgi:hypothetical protein